VIPVVRPGHGDAREKERDVMSPSTPKPTLAIVSNRSDESCGIAAYTRLREKALAAHFDVTVFDLRTSTRMKPRGRAAEAEQFINQVCRDLPKFDLVAIDSELGIWGDTLEEFEERLTRCCNSATKLVLTLHALETSTGESWPLSLLYGNLLRQLAIREPSRPFYILTATSREKGILESIHGITNIKNYPATHIFSEEKQGLLSERKNGSAWRTKHGFNDHDILIGLFGSFSGYKDYNTAIKALEVLPENYKIVIVGGAHPYSIKPLKTDEHLANLLNFIESRKLAGSNIETRIRFLGVVDDTTFRSAMAQCDFIVTPYLEVGQANSGVASMALELGLKLITTRNFTFLENRQFYEDGFEMFDIGNHLELRDKILHFDKKKSHNAQEMMNKYTPEGLADLYSNLYASMSSDAYQNSSDVARLDAFIGSLRRTWRMPVRLSPTRSPPRRSSRRKSSRRSAHWPVRKARSPTPTTTSSGSSESSRASDRAGSSTRSSSAGERRR
jgi:glycosyltransferase involved in cell wall biosynthesis